MGASWQADAFFVAFRLPNTFRRLFGEGAFSAGFVPLYAQRLQGEDGEVEAKNFSEEVLAVFVPTLVIFTVSSRSSCRSSSRHLGLSWRETGAGHVPDQDHLPLSDPDQPGVAVLGHPQQPGALHRRRLRPGSAQSGDAVGADLRPGRRDHYRHRAVDRGHRRRRSPARAAARRLQARRHRPQAAPAAHDAWRSAVRPGRHPGHVRRRRLPDQRLHRHVLPGPHRHRLAELFQLRRPPEPAATGSHRRRARHGHPAAGQPPCRRRRAGQGGAGPGPGDRAGHAAVHARRAGAAVSAGPLVSAPVPGRPLHRRRCRNSRP